jgi:multidrug transporter EmrE-like cation transporter
VCACVCCVVCVCACVCECVCVWFLKYDSVFSTLLQIAHMAIS